MWDSETEERFWAKVARANHLECWNWQASTDKNGYGRFRVQGRDLRAHRVSYILAYGPILAGKFVCHSCDNPGCVNPAHLWAGSLQDNKDDCVQKKRVAFGGAHANTRLSAEAVRSIRMEWVPGTRSLSRLGRKYGVSHVQIRNIIYNKSRKYDGVIE